jgi:AcrR family transcriptional regulator
MSEHRRYHIGDLPGRLVREARAMLKVAGLKRLNLRALAAQAGITAGSMYHHYKSKRELLGVLAAGGFIELGRDLERACDEAGVAESLSAWAGSYFRFAEREPALFALMFDPEIAGLAPVAEAKATTAQPRLVQASLRARI